MEWLFLGLVGFLSGIISGMGIGGGTLLIPALIFLKELGQQEAQMINLLYFVPTALIALFFHKKSNQIETSVLKPIILFGLLGAAGGAFLAIHLEAGLLKKLFGGFLFFMGLTEFFKKEKKEHKISNDGDNKKSK